MPIKIPNSAIFGVGTGGRRADSARERKEERTRERDGASERMRPRARRARRGAERERGNAPRRRGKARTEGPTWRIVGGEAPCSPGAPSATASRTAVSGDRKTCSHASLSLVKLPSRAFCLSTVCAAPRARPARRAFSPSTRARLLAVCEI